LGREPKNKKEVEKAVKELVKLPLIEKNFSEIVSRLDILVKEKNEYDQSNKI